MTNISFAERAQWRTILKWPSGCSGDSSDQHFENAGLFFNQLDTPSRYLVQIECNLYAYQADSYYALLDFSGGSPTSTLLTFGVPDKSSPSNYQAGKLVSAKLLLGSARYDQTTKLLNVLTKDEGVGDCGSIANYSFEANSAKLESLYVKPLCDQQILDEQHSIRIK